MTSTDNKLVSNIGSAVSSSLIGKTSANGNFIVSYTSATTITVSSLPVPITTLSIADIVRVIQISTTGVFTYWTTANSQISISGAVITVSNAAFVSNDVFIVETNIPQSVLYTSTENATDTLTKNLKVSGKYVLDRTLLPLADGYSGTLAVGSNHELYVSMDSLTSGENQAFNVLTTIAYRDREINKGNVFSWSDGYSSVANATPRYFRIVTPNNSKLCVLTIRASCGASGGVWTFYKAPTVNVAGTAGTPLNLYGDSANVATATTFSGSTVTSTGTFMWSEVVGSGGGSIVETVPRVLSANTIYILEFVAAADSTKAYMDMVWIERDNSSWDDVII